MGAELFRQYLQPVKSVDDYMADMDQRDLRRAQLAGTVRQNALADLVAQATQQETQQRIARDNALARLTSDPALRNNPQALEERMLGDPLLMDQGVKYRQSRLEADKTIAGTRKDQAEAAKTDQGTAEAKRKAAWMQVLAFGSPDAALASLNSAGDISMQERTQHAREIQAASDPQAFNLWKARTAAAIVGGPEFAKALMPVLGSTNLGGTEQYTSRDPITGAVTINRTDRRTATPGELLTDSRDRLPTFDPLNGFWIDRQKRTITPALGQDGKPVPSQKTGQATIELRKEFTALPEVQNYKLVVPLVAQARSAPDTSQGDISLIYAAGKIYDPASVVREGEMNMVIKSGSPEERIGGMVNYLKGGGRLTPSARKSLVDAMQRAVDERKTMYDAARKTYDAVARKNGVAPEDVFVDIPDAQSGAARSVIRTKADAIINGGK